MKLLVCIKAVHSKYVSDNLTGTEKYVINPYDFLALCKAVNLKNEHTQVTCLCMGSQDVIEVLYKCLALGADNAILLSDPAFAGSDTYATSYILERAIEKIDHDFIICGNRSVDGETGQVGYNLGVRKKYFCVDNVCNVMLDAGKALKVEIAAGKTKNIAVIKAPALIIFNDFISEMSVSLFAIKKAKKKQIMIWGKDDIDCDYRYIGQAGSKTRVTDSINIVSQHSAISMNDITSYEAMRFLLEEMQKITVDMESERL